ncbi:MAG: Ppx/GppA phosphatase family protein [Hyphomicrobium sp.]
MTHFQDASGAGEASAGLEPIGVIDIGSNSVRLVVYEGAVRSLTPVFNEKVLCGLGRSVATSGSLASDAVERAIHALTRFKSISQVLDVKNVKAIATAAVREASNGAEFIRRGEQAAGVKIDILSGEKEAQFAAQGIMMGFVNPDGVAGDLGGGSLELIDIVGERLRDAATLPLGGLRLIDTTGNKLDAAVLAVDAALAGLPWLTQGKGRTFYAVGGTWRALAKLHMETRGYPLRVMHGYQLAAKDAEEYCEFIRKAKKGTVPGMDGVAKARREVLPYGALVLERLIKKMQPSNVVFSVFGIREGLIYGLLPERERRGDPLLSFSEDYARARSRSIDHAHELCRWTDQLFADPAFEETADERRLRHAACLLSDVGWRAHPDYRGEQSLNTIAHAGLGGIDHEGRIFLALAVYFRHEAGEFSPDGLPERLKTLVSKRVVKRARIIGAAVRAAHMLSIGKPGVIDEAPLSVDNGKLILTIPKVYAGLDGERLRRRFETLAGLVGCQAVVRIGM